MISNPNLVFYACIAKGSMILAEFISPEETGVDTIAQRCIEKAPAHHSIFSHTIRNRTYTFLMDDPFVYFAIFDENIEKLESFWFLNRVKSAFQDQDGTDRMKDVDKLTSFCFQDLFHSTFREILLVEEKLVSPPPLEEYEVGRDSSMESKGGEKSLAALLVKPPKLLMKKKKKKSFGESDGDHHVEDGGASYSVDGKQKAKQIWRKHVWVVLTLDLAVCAVLFGVWLCVCRGFECIDG